MAEFLRIVQNEWIKLFRRRRFLVVLLLGLILVGFYAYTVYNHQQSQAKYNDPAYQKQMMQANLERMENLKKSGNSEQTGLTAAQIDLEIENMKKAIAQLESQPAGSTEPQFDEAKQTQRLDAMRKQLEAAPPGDLKLQGQLKMQIKLDEYRLEHKLPGAGMRDQTLWSSVMQFLDVGTQLFIPLLCVLLVADMVSGEQTGGTIKLLLTRPPTRGKILLAKYAASLIASLAVVGILLAALVLSLIGIGTGGAQDPVLTGVEYSTVSQMMDGQMQTTIAADPTNASIISTSRFMWGSLLFTLAATIGMSTFGFFCSMLVRSAAVSTGIALGVIIIGTIIVHAAEGFSAIKFFITPHFNLPYAWTGQLSQQFGVPMSLWQSLGILAAWIVVMYGIGHTLFKKRDVLG